MHRILYYTLREKEALMKQYQGLDLYEDALSKGLAGAGCGPGDCSHGLNSVHHSLQAI